MTDARASSRDAGRLALRHDEQPDADERARARGRANMHFAIRCLCARNADSVICPSAARTRARITEGHPRHEFVSVTRPTPRACCASRPSPPHRWPGSIALPARAAGADSSGVTLVLGDQAGGLRALAEAARVLDGAPYRFRWANFQGAAPLFEAQRAGAIDLAPAGDLPVLTAALGDPALRIVATRVGSPTSLGIVVQPDSPVRTVADLKGRTVVVSSARGSISQYQLYGALREHGLAPADVDVRFVLPVDAFAAFEAKQIGIWATFDPYYGHAVRRGARVVRDGSGINCGARVPHVAGRHAERSRKARGARRRARPPRPRRSVGARASGRLRERLCVAHASAARCGGRHRTPGGARAAQRIERRHRRAAARRRSRGRRCDPADARRCRVDRHPECFRHVAWQR
ncbi:hypothetical protein BDAG_03068 [Burkholderia dolosa AU0158]|nr:hypothetical protein BDAG_03068 [Burkholderia dolosa AU0158]